MGSHPRLAFAAVTLLLLTSISGAQAQYEPLPDGPQVDQLLRDLEIVALMEDAGIGDAYAAIPWSTLVWENFPDGYDLDDLLTSIGIRDAFYSAGLGDLYEAIPFAELSLEFLLSLLELDALQDLIDGLLEPDLLDDLLGEFPSPEDLACNPFEATEIPAVEVTGDDDFEGTPLAPKFCLEGTTYVLRGYVVGEGDGWGVRVADTTAAFLIDDIEFGETTYSIELDGVENGMIANITAPDQHIRIIDSEVTLQNVELDGLIIEGDSVVHWTDGTANFVEVTDGELHIDDVEIDHQFQLIDATVEATIITFTGSHPNSPLVDQSGGSTTLLGFAATNSQTDPCFEGDGDFTLKATNAQCTEQLFNWGTGTVTFEASSLELQDGTFVVGDGTDVVVESSQLEAGNNLVELVGGSLTVDDSTLLGQEDELARIGGETDVDFTDVTVLQGPTSLFTLTDSLTGGEISLANNDFRSTGDQFDVLPGLNWAHTITLDTGYEAQPSLIGGTGKGGNAWGASDVADYDGDGIARDPYSPPGISEEDNFPLVSPNFGPTVAIEAVPNPRNFTQVITPNDVIDFTATGTDAEDPTLRYIWEIDGNEMEVGSFSQAFTEGLHTIKLTGIDSNFASATQAYTLESVPADQAPILDALEFTPDCNDEALFGSLPLSVPEGTTGCLRATVTEPDGPGESWHDFWYLDLGETSSTTGAYRLLGSEENVLQQGMVLNGAADDEQPFLRTQDAGWAMIDGTLYAVFGCDGTLDSGDLRVYPGNGTKVLPSHPDFGASYSTTCAPTLPIYQDGTQWYVDGDGDLIMDVHLAASGPTNDFLPPAPTLGAAEIGVADRDGNLRFSWDVVIGGQRTGGSDLVIPVDFHTAGTSQVNLFLGDGGDNGALTIHRHSVDVQSTQAAIIRFSEIDVWDRTGNEISVIRGHQFTIEDASVAAPGTHVTSVQWNCAACPDQQTGDTFSSAIHTAGDYTITQTVETSNGQIGVGVIPVKVLLQPPSASLDISPTAFESGDPVRISAVGPIDLGSSIVPGNNFAIWQHSQGSQVFLNEAPATFGPEDTWYGTLDATLSGDVAADDLDLGRAGQLVSFCFIDENLNGQLEPNEPVYVGDCNFIAPGHYRLFHPALESGEVVSGDPDDGLALWTHPGELVNADGPVLRLGATIAEFDIRIPGGQIDGTDASIGEAGDSIQMLAADGLFIDMDNDDQISENDHRLTDFSYQTSGIATLFGVTPNTVEAAICEHESGLLFLGTCTESTGQIRLQSEGIIGTGLFGEEVSAFSLDGALPLTAATGTLGSGTNGWIFDRNDDGVVSVGDVRLTATNAVGAAPGTRIAAPSAGDQGTPLQFQFSCASGCEFDGFAQGIIGTDATETAIFSSSGTKVIRMLVSDQDGTQVELTREIVVDNLPPTPVIVLPSAPIYSTEPRIFDASFSFDVDGDPAGLDLSYRWDFGDGTAIQSGVLAPHQFPEPGTYTVKLTVIDGDDVNPISASTTLEVVVENRVPLPDFTISPSNIATQSTVLLDATPSIDLDGSISTYQWTVKQAGFADVELSGIAPQLQFARPGEVTIVLATTDNLGGQATVEKTLQVANQLPTAKLAVDANARLPPAIFHFSAGGSSDPEGTILTYTFDFGDGVVETGPSSVRSHEYTQRGQFEVKLTVTDEDDGQATKTLLVTVLNQPPVGVAQGPASGKVGETISYTAFGSDSDGDDISFSWTFSDGTNEFLGTGETFSVTPSQWGAYVLTLTTTDSAGASTDKTYNVNIASLKPTATISPTAITVDLGQSVTISGSATDSDGTIVGHFFDMGDGTTSFGQSMTHTYAAPGEYTVRYTATDNSQQSSSATAIVTVFNPAPVITDASVSQSTANVGDLLLFQVTATDEGGDLEYTWDFGDGVVVEARTPTHVYQLPGLFNAEVTVEDAYGKKATQTVAVEIIKPSSGVEEDSIETDEEVGVEREARDTPHMTPMLALLFLALLAWRRK